MLKPFAWKETRARMRADHARLLELLNRLAERPRSSAYTHPSFVCVFLYRISNHLCRRNRTWIARLIWQVNLMLTGADISEYADIGPGLVVCNPPGVAMMGTAGSNLTVMACAGIGGELGREHDIGAGDGLAIIGSDVIMEPHSGILGPIRIGDRVRIRAGVVITRDVPDDTVVVGAEPRFMSRSVLP